ncbi:hypothetical protein E2320_010311 [Naja naja]|nr:hypothetical protein E2320_010311 [Naja naja]
MSAPPNFPPFRPLAETWTSYINRFKCVMDAANLSDIPSNRKKAYFLSFCGATVFDTATAMLAPQTVKAVSWEELQEVLGNHYAPKPSRIARRHAFCQRTQAENESVSEYVAALRSAALHCGFRDQLDDMLLDQLVCGVRDLRLQRRLLAKADLTLKQGIEEAQAAELSSVSAAAIQKANNLPGSKPSTAVNYEDAAYEDEYLEEEEEVNRLRTPRPFQKRRPPIQQLICLSCGGNHLRTTCRFRNAVCLNCQRKAARCRHPRTSRLSGHRQRHGLHTLTGSNASWMLRTCQTSLTGKSIFPEFLRSHRFDTATAMLAPQTVKAVSWEELQEVLGNHYARSHRDRLHAFRQRTQAENESVSEYVAALRSAALHCGFRDQLDDMLLDQLRLWGKRPTSTKMTTGKSRPHLKTRYRRSPSS